MQTVPESFARAVRDYDVLLSCHYHPILQEFAIERTIEQSEHWLKNGLKAVFHARANRKPKAGVWLPQDVKDAALRRRRESQARLDALARGNRVLFFGLKDTSTETLRAVLFTLRETDLFRVHDEEFNFSGDPRANKRAVANRMQYEEDRAEEAALRPARDDNRHKAAEAYMHKQLRGGEGVSMRNPAPVSKASRRALKWVKENVAVPSAA